MRSKSPNAGTVFEAGAAAGEGQLLVQERRLRFAQTEAGSVARPVGEEGIEQTPDPGAAGRVTQEAPREGGRARSPARSPAR